MACCGIFHDNGSVGDTQGCRLSDGHEGPHEFKGSDGDVWQWETDMDCDCEHCASCEGDYCTTYWRRSQIASNAAMKSAHELVKTLVNLHECAYQMALPEVVDQRTKDVARIPQSSEVSVWELQRALQCLKSVNEHLALHGGGQAAINQYYEAAWGMRVDPGEVSEHARIYQAGRRYIEKN